MRTIALGVHEGRIVTNAQAHEKQWRLYAVGRPPLNIEFIQLTKADMTKLRKFSEQITAWKEGRVTCASRLRSHLKS